MSNFTFNQILMTIRKHRKQVRPEDNLRPEGEFQTPEKPQYRAAGRPQQVPEHTRRQFETKWNIHVPEKPQFRPAECPKQV
jgi:hypothetical protein